MKQYNCISKISYVFINKKEIDWMKWLGEERINLVACLNYLFFVGCEKEYIEFAHLLSSYISANSLIKSCRRYLSSPVSIISLLS